MPGFEGYTAATSLSDDDLLLVLDNPSGAKTTKNITALNVRKSLSSVINVKDYGAKGDDSTDDTAAIQAAINAAISAGAVSTVRNGLATVYLPPGTYVITSPLQVYSVIDFRLMGSGLTTRIKAGAVGMTCLLDLNGVAESYFSDFMLTGSGSNSCTRALWVRWSNTTIARQTSFNEFHNILVRNLLWTRAACELGDPAFPAIATDTDTWINCNVQGLRTADGTDLTNYQNGFLVGDGTGGNNLIHTFVGCVSSGVRYGLNNDHSQVAWFGGQLQVNDADLLIGSDGYTVVKGVRSEGSRRLADTAGGGSTASFVSLEDISWQSNNLHPDNKFINWNQLGTMRIAGVKIPYLAAHPTPQINTGQAGTLDINGLATGTPIGSLITTTGTPSTAKTRIFGYHQLASDGSTAATTTGFGGRMSAFTDGTLTTAAGVLKSVNRGTFSNANYTVPDGVTYVAQVGTMSAQRTVTIPNASQFFPGDEFILADESGTVSAGNSLFISSASTINGGSSYTMYSPYGMVRFISNGTNWFTDRDMVHASYILPSASATNIFNVKATGGGVVTSLSASDTDEILTLGGAGVGNAQNRVRGTSAGYYFDRQDGTQEWLVYRTGGPGGLYVRDMVNARMHVTHWPGASSTAAQTEFASDVRVLGPLYISGTTISVQSGTGSPEASKTAPVGSLWLRTDGSAGSTFYTKASGSGNTGWAPLDVTLRRGFSNADTTATAADRVIAQTGTLSAARVVTLPAANAVPGGTVLQILDESGTATGTFTLSWARAGSDTINGGTSNVVAVNAAYGNGKIMSDGTSKWTTV